MQGALVLFGVICTGHLSLPLDTTRVLTAVLAAAIITGVRGRPHGVLCRLLAFRPLAYVGLLSYGLYLWHPVVFHVAQDLVPLDTLAQRAAWAPVVLGATAAATIASYYLVEKPFNALKDRLPTVTRSVTPAAAPAEGPGDAPGSAAPLERG